MSSVMVRIRAREPPSEYIDMPVEVVTPQLLKEIFGCARISFLRKSTSIYVPINGKWVPGLTGGEYFLNTPIANLGDGGASGSGSGSIASVVDDASIPPAPHAVPTAAVAADGGVSVAADQSVVSPAAQAKQRRPKTDKTSDIPYRLYLEPQNEKERLWNLHAPEMFHFNSEMFKTEKAIRMEFKTWYNHYHTILGACNQILEIQKRRIATWLNALRQGKRLKDLPIKIEHTETELSQVEGRVSKVGDNVDFVLKEEELKTENRFEPKVTFFNRLRLDLDYSRTLLSNARAEIQQVVGLMPLPALPAPSTENLTGLPQVPEESPSAKRQRLDTGDQMQTEPTV